MNAAKPADVREFVRREIPIIRLCNQRVLDPEIIHQGIAGWVFARLAAPGAKTLVEFAYIVLHILAGQQWLKIVRVSVEGVVQILQGIMHERIIDLPGKLLIQFSRRGEGDLQDPADAGRKVGVSRIKNWLQSEEHTEGVDGLFSVLARVPVAAVTFP